MAKQKQTEEQVKAHVLVDSAPGQSENVVGIDASSLDTLVGVADADPEGQVKARVLVACAHGQPDDIVVVDASSLDTLVGVVDADPEAVAYAESLAQ